MSSSKCICKSTESTDECCSSQHADYVNTIVLSQYPSNHEVCYQNTRTSPITTPTTMAAATAACKINTVLTHSSPNRDASMNRRFSESSADELYRSDESFKQGGWNQNMRNELLMNSSIALASKRRNGNCPRFHGDDVDDGNGCCCFGGGSKKNRISDAVDVGIRVLLVFIFIFLETAKPFKRKIHPEEMWLYKNPRTPDIVSVQALLLSVIFGPLFVTMLQWWLTGDRRDFRASSWVWTLALGLNGLVTSILKICVGRHRPDFFYRCFPDGVEVLNNVSHYANGSLDFYNCTGDIRQISEGRKSFPSGHASFSFVGFGFIAIILSAKLHALSARGRGQSWRLCVSVLPLLLAALISVSRTCDYHHHWEDVVAGGSIGLSITYLVYRQYYPSLFSSHCHRPYFRICGRLSETAQLNLHPRIYKDLSSKDGIDHENVSYEDHGDAPSDERRRLM
ncbi:phospholipid phosphatase 5 isoform X2 [Anastrepha ludens]|uniref:phospholipid phosphatase 5 isoform X2 n=1 Tax=Anastrepha ludens TaxID=28586 RepID=UPI0023AF26C1|nr:phospholipid phosphatase 5 isoform X2 [Anastrepha ludens]